jgi:flagellar hook-basal body complex protein FliE
MPSKKVTDRKKSAEIVVAAARSHGAAVQNAASQTLRLVMKKDEATPDFTTIAEYLARSLERVTDTMIAADDAHEAELRDDAAPREQREAGAAALSEAIGEMREIGVGLLGSKAIGSLGLNAPSPRDPAGLARFAAQISITLRNFDAKKIKSRVRGASFHADEWAERIDELRSPLDKALADVAREQREAIATQSAKDKAIEAYDDVFGRTANLLSALLRYGGDEALAKRLRPSARRPGQIVDEEPSEGASAAGNPAGGPTPATPDA